MKINLLSMANRVDVFHAYAELISVTCPRGRGGFLHTQDDYEFMYVLDGTANHYINGTDVRIGRGDIAFVRPQDVHDVETLENESIQFFNVEVSAAFWKKFCDSIEIDPDRPGLGAPELGSVARVSEEFSESCLDLFLDFEQRAQHTRSHLELYRFLSNALWHLRYIQEGESSAAASRLQPVWFIDACLSMHDWQNLSGGLDRFVELSGVTVQHLSRVLKASTGQSPTEYINALRLKRAATLLTGTDLTISDVALDCGFENLPYFYRIFQAKYGITPRRFRMRRNQLVGAQKTST